MKGPRVTSYCGLIVALLLCAADCLAQQPGITRRPETQLGTISGRVVDSSGEPLAGASVNFGTITSSARRKTATADNHGEFKLEGLAPGLYSIFVSMPGYIYVSRFSGGVDLRNYYRVGDSPTFTMTKGGVITGSVVSQNGPVVGTGVFASRVRDADGKKLAMGAGTYERRTDDRGVFRFFGLPPGSYILVATSPRVGTILPSAYDNDVPTYYPSGTRDTAAEITVREGDEVTADIQYRGEPGHAISGNITGAVRSQIQGASLVTINLTDVRDHTQIVNTGTSLPEGGSFAILGVPDGEYELTARNFLPTRDELRSPPQRVTVRGADVTGIQLTLGPLASIAGRLVFEPDPRAPCAKRKDAAAQETLLYARSLPPPAKPRSERARAPLSPLANYSSFAVGAADGSFTLKNLPAAQYQLDFKPPDSGWFTKSISIGPIQTPAARIASLATAKDGIPVKNAQRITGVLVIIDEGAAGLRGRVRVPDGENLPDRLVIYLTPAEKDASENVLRFYEAATAADGSFSIDSISPGRYFILASPRKEDETAVASSIRQDSNLRAAILQQPASTKKEVFFKPCEQIDDYQLPYVTGTPR